MADAATTVADRLLEPGVRRLATNLEVYASGLAVDADAATIQVGRRAAPRLPATLRRRAGGKTTAREYRHRHLVYALDAADDARRAWSRVPICEVAAERLYGLALREEPLPIHKFPSTADMDVAAVERTVYRFDHPRVTLVVEHEPAEGLYTTFVRADLRDTEAGDDRLRAALVSALHALIVM